MNDQQQAEQVEQRHRDAAAAWMSVIADPWEESIRAGEHDGHPLIQQFVIFEASLRSASAAEGVDADVTAWRITANTQAFETVFGAEQAVKLRRILASLPPSTEGAATRDDAERRPWPLGGAPAREALLFGERPYTGLPDHICASCGHQWPGHEADCPLTAPAPAEQEAG